jgi:putative Holliday junction resolvase
MNDAFLALDVGSQRIGIAVANPVARLPRPFVTIINNDAALDTIVLLCEQESIGSIIVGLPRDMNSNSTEQTRFTQDFVEALKHKTDLPIYWQDEALTSQKAEQELIARGKPYAKEDIDSLAAVFILEDFLQIHREART